MKKILFFLFTSFFVFSNAFGATVHLECKIFFPDNTSFSKNWSLDSKKNNYWSKFADNFISWVEVVLPEHNASGKYSYTYFYVDRRTGNLLVEFSEEINQPVKKNHKKLKIEDTLQGKCEKGSGQKLF